jgi:hypothetical protein
MTWSILYSIDFIGQERSHSLIIVAYCRAELAKAYLIAGILFEVLCAVNNDEGVGPEVIFFS